uniref:Nonstructural protein 1 n=1 Tax=Turdus naumanni densovirus TaxID=2794544 RepID=A0A8A4XEC2_9VIRU|nr:MAG: nonstructural protein 1 [Turdus naumanni densovirus]
MLKEEDALFAQLTPLQTRPLKRSSSPSKETSDGVEQGTLVKSKKRKSMTSLISSPPLQDPPSQQRNERLWILQKMKRRLSLKLPNVNPALRSVMTLMISLMTTTQSELMDKASPEEWFHIYTSGKTIKAVNDAFEIGRCIVEKYFLTAQRENRWNWLIQFAKHDENQCYFFDSLLYAHGINKKQFVQDIYDWLMCTHHKKNALFLFGPPNTGKTFIARLLTQTFLVGNMNLKGVTSDFYYEALLNKSIAVMEELWVIPLVCDDFKSILGGVEIDINKKHVEMQRLQRIPVVITCNHDRLGRGFLQPVDEDALQNRCYKYHFNTDITQLFSCDVTVGGFADWLLINYETL